jgi:hypothetical protein
MLGDYRNAAPKNTAAMARQARILIIVPHNGSGCISFGRLILSFFIYA